MIEPEFWTLIAKAVVAAEGVAEKVNVVPPLLEVGVIVTELEVEMLKSEESPVVEPVELET